MKRPIRLVRRSPGLVETFTQLPSTIIRMNRIEDIERQLSICRSALADYRSRGLDDDNPNIALILDQIKSLEERVRGFSGERVKSQSIERPL